MAEKSSVKLHNRLFFKLYLSYACMLAGIALLIGIIFMKLYESTTMQNYRDQLMTQAEGIANQLQQYIIDEAYDEAINYVDLIENLDRTIEIWVISNYDSSAPMDSSMENINLSHIDLQKEYKEVIDKAFHNKKSSLSFYSDINEDVRNVVSVPIKGSNGEVGGAVIYSSQAKSQQRIINQSTKIIINSIIVSLIISFIFVTFFAKGISVPITKMSKTAQQLALNNYQVKTHIKRKDEIGNLASTIDILSDRLLENDIERKNLDQMRFDFFANVSHELRTPITVIRAYTETLADRVVTDEEKVMQYYQRMLLECKSMERLVGDLLVLSKMQNPDFAIEKEPVNIIQVFDDIIRSLSTISSQKSIRIEITKYEDSYLILGDYDRLRQMFIVIIDNAIKFSPENSIIHIKIIKEDKLLISIRDEGIGISEEELPNIFDKFYKSKLRQNAKGSGLGLAIAKQIALKHDGAIDVKSEVGVGTEFVFTLPYINERYLKSYQ